MNQDSSCDDDFDIEELQKTLDTLDWSFIDSSLNQIPNNPYYQVQISDPKTQKYYLRFRYILQHQETHFQPYTLALTTYLLKFSTNNYYALMMRKKFVFHQISHLSQTQMKCNSTQCNLIKGKSEVRQVLERELNFMNNLLEDNPKEYHVWTYKKDLISAILNSPKKSIQQKAQIQIRKMREQVYVRENKFIFSLLIEDCRNYHAWDYRFWLVTFVDKIQAQLQWIQDLLRESQQQNPLVKQTINQLQNSEFKAQEIKVNWSGVNSLWSHKFNLIKYLKANSPLHSSSSNSITSNNFDLKILLKKQIYETVELLKRDKKNEPIWNYFGGLINLGQAQLNEQTSSEISALLRNFFNLEQSKQLELDNLNRFQLNFVKKFHFLLLQKSLQGGDLQKQVYSKLKVIDGTRTKYYDYKLQKLQI